MRYAREERGLDGNRIKMKMMKIVSIMNEAKYKSDGNEESKNIKVGHSAPLGRKLFCGAFHKIIGM